MQLPDKIKARILRSDEGNLLNIIAGTVNELISYLEAKENEDKRRDAQIQNLRSGWTDVEIKRAGFHSKTEEMMFKAEDVEIIDDFPYLFIKVKANGFETRAEAEAAREALLKLKK